MLFSLFHALRRRHVWLALGAVCFILAAFAYNGEGVSFLFGGDSVRLLFASLGGLGLAVIGYWISRSTLNVFKSSRVALPLVLASVILTAGGIVDVPALIDRTITRELFAALILLVVSVIGVMTMFGLKKKKTGQWSKGNQPGR
jgi:hypothetical protein